MSDIDYGTDVIEELLWILPQADYIRTVRTVRTVTSSIQIMNVSKSLG